MIIISVGRIREFEAKLGELKSEAPEILWRALNNAVLSVRDEIVDKVVQEYTIGPEAVKETISVYRANTQNITGVVKSVGTRRRLINFKVSPNRYDPKNLPDVLKVAVKRDDLKDMKGAFISRGTSTGNINVFKREGRKRYPVHIKYGPSVPEMAGSKNVKKYIEAEALKRIDENIAKELESILGGE